MPEPYTATNAARMLVFKEIQNKINVLLVKDRHKEGLLFPGGAVDKNELPRIAVVRECAEEVGLEFDANTISLIAMTAKIKANRFGATGITHYYAAYLEKKHTEKVKLDPLEIEKYVWAPAQDLIEQDANNQKYPVSVLVTALVKHATTKGASGYQEMMDYRNKPMDVEFVALQK